MTCQVQKCFCFEFEKHTLQKSIIINKIFENETENYDLDKTIA